MPHHLGHHLERRVRDPNTAHLRAADARNPRSMPSSEYRGAGHAEALPRSGRRSATARPDCPAAFDAPPMTPRAAADQIARERLRRALALRRRF
jgi:hypothetical protein